jgi:hypothetical protein
MQWPVDSEWDPADPGEEEDDDYEAFNQRRMVSLTWGREWSRHLSSHRATITADTLGNRPDRANRFRVDEEQDRGICFGDVQPDSVPRSIRRTVAAS